MSWKTTLVFTAIVVPVIFVELLGKSLADRMHEVATDVQCTGLATRTAGDLAQDVTNNFRRNTLVIALQCHDQEGEYYVEAEAPLLRQWTESPRQVFRCNLRANHTASCTPQHP